MRFAALFLTALVCAAVAVSAADSSSSTGTDRMDSSSTTDVRMSSTADVRMSSSADVRSSATPSSTGRTDVSSTGQDMKSSTNTPMVSSTGMASTGSAVTSSTGGGVTPGAASGACQKITQKFGYSEFAGGDSQILAIQDLIVLVAAGTVTNVHNVTVCTTCNGGADTGIFLISDTKIYFNGANDYRNATGSQYVVDSPYKSATTPTPNYLNGYSTTSGYDFNQLKNLKYRLALFFGTALGCAQPSTGYPAYTSATPAGVAFDQYQIHANMKIGAGPFAAFNNQLAAAALAAGATGTNDLDGVSAALASFGRNSVDNSKEICTQEGCPCATGITGAPACDNSAASTAQVSLVTLVLAAAAAFFAMRR